jgi:hypothetical protein
MNMVTKKKVAAPKEVEVVKTVAEPVKMEEAKPGPASLLVCNLMAAGMSLLEAQKMEDHEKASKN